MKILNVPLAIRSHRFSPVLEKTKMSIERWQTAWRELIAPGAPFEVVTPDDGAPRYFRHAAHDLLQVFDAGRVHGDREFLVWHRNA